MSSDLTKLNAVSSIDGRYRRDSEALAPFMSEQALMQYRVMVEVLYFIALSGLKDFGPRQLSTSEQGVLAMLLKLPDEDAAIIKAIEVKGHNDIPATNHDVKAIEYYLKLKLNDSTLKDELEWIHFGLTSEDINNLSYTMMLRDGLEKVIVPALQEILAELKKLVHDHAALPMLARTHGQSASPTTFGKEINVFVKRLEREVTKLTEIKLLAKLNGATGNYNALHVAAPDIDWFTFSEKFVETLNTNHEIKLAHNDCTTQIESHDSVAESFQTLARINTILIDFDQDVWRYISDGWIKQKPVAGEVGSSTMPHKVNPINFENSEGNLGLANALCNFFATKLSISRLQRDLSDSTVQRNFGTALAHSLIAYRATLKGLSKIAVNEEAIKADLNAHPEVLAEAIQTILRREGVPMPYEKLKEVTRGKTVTMENLQTFIKNLDVTDSVRKELQALTPENYIGLAEKIAKK